MGIVDIRVPFDMVRMKHIHPFRAGRDNKDRDLMFCLVEEMRGGQAFFDKCIGKDVVLVDGQDEYPRILIDVLGIDALNELIAKRKLKFHNFGGMWLYLKQKDGFTFMTIMNHRIWGTIYCINSDKSLSEVREAYLSTLKACWEVGWNLQKLCPPSNLANDLLSRSVLKIALPNLSKGDIDEDTLFLATQCIKAPTHDTRILGRPEGVICDYDLNWAFPSALGEMPSFNPNEFYIVKSNKYQKHATEGFLQCEVYLNENVGMGSLPMRVGMINNYRLLSPVGHLKGYWTKTDIDVILKYSLGTVKIIRGSWMIPKGSRITCPYKASIDILSKLRDNPEMNVFAKEISPTTWGKTLTSYNEYPYATAFYNPLHAAYLMSKVRSRIMEIAALYPDETSLIANDGIVLTKEIPEIYLPTSNSMGGIKKAILTEFIVGSNLYKKFLGYDKAWDFERYGIRLPDRIVGIGSILAGVRDVKDLGKHEDGGLVGYTMSNRVMRKGIELSDIENNVIESRPPNISDLEKIFNNTEGETKW